MDCPDFLNDNWIQGSVLMGLNEACRKSRHRGFVWAWEISGDGFKLFMSLCKNNLLELNFIVHPETKVWSGCCKFT